MRIDRLNSAVSYYTLFTDLCEVMLAMDTDFIVLEGMGRALHTNMHARFKCDTLKLAIVKNEWLAKSLGGKLFSVICKYERFRE